MSGRPPFDHLLAGRTESVGPLPHLGDELIKTDQTSQGV